MKKCKQLQRGSFYKLKHYNDQPVEALINHLKQTAACEKLFGSDVFLFFVPTHGRTLPSNAFETKHFCF